MPPGIWRGERERGMLDYVAHILIIYDGRVAYTTAQAARRHGIQPSTMRKELDRLGIDPLPEPLDARTPLYDAEQVDAAMSARPGRGANLRRVER